MNYRIRHNKAEMLKVNLLASLAKYTNAAHYYVLEM